MELHEGWCGHCGRFSTCMRQCPYCHMPMPSYQATMDSPLLGLGQCLPCPNCLDLRPIRKVVCPTCGDFAWRRVLASSWLLVAAIGAAFVCLALLPRSFQLAGFVICLVGGVCLGRRGIATWFEIVCDVRPHRPALFKGLIAVFLVLLLLVLGLFSRWWRFRDTAVSDSVPVSRAKALERIPEDWVVVQVNPQQLDNFLNRLPRIQKWLAKAEEFEKKFPPSDADRRVERLHLGTQHLVFAASPHATARMLWDLRALAGPGPLPGDLDGMLRLLAVQDEFQRQEPEWGFVVVKAAWYRPDRVLAAETAVGNLSGKPAWRVGDNYYLEPEPGILISGTSRAGVARLAQKPARPAEHAPFPSDACAVLQFNPSFLRSPVWARLFQTPEPHLDGKAAGPSVWDGNGLGGVQIIASLSPTGVIIEARIQIRDDKLLAKTRQDLEQDRGKERVPPLPNWAKNFHRGLDGRQFIVRFEIEDQVLDGLIPTPEEVEGWANFLEALRRAFEKR